MRPPSERLVEIDVPLGRVQNALHFVDELAQPRQIRIASSPGRFLDGVEFDDSTHIEELEDRNGVESKQYADRSRKRVGLRLANECPAPVPDVDQSHYAQHLYRLAQRYTADSQLFGEHRFGRQPVAGLDLPAGYETEQTVENRLAEQRPAYAGPRRRSVDRSNS